MIEVKNSLENALAQASSATEADQVARATLARETQRLAEARARKVNDWIAPLESRPGAAPDENQAAHFGRMTNGDGFPRRI
jgi:hypothetical protein